MFDWLKQRLGFGKKEFGSEEYEAWGEAMQAAMERVLGPMEDLVGHALIPFQIGGPVDMYYFCNHLPGTVFATMELMEPDGTGPKPNCLGTYELVTCTKLANTNSLDEGHQERLDRIKEDRLTAFETMEMRMRSIMSGIGRYSYDAVLQPGQTAELPRDEGEPYCLIFDELDTKGVPFEFNGRRYGLLLIMEVFESEMRYAMENGSYALFEKLKAAGAYPYSDLDREAVV